MRAPTKSKSRASDSPTPDALWEALQRALEYMEDGKNLHGILSAYRSAIERVALTPPTPERECDTCGGDGWVLGIDADPLPSGEPGEPYQTQDTCPDCGGGGFTPTTPETLLDVRHEDDGSWSVSIRAMPGHVGCGATLAEAYAEAHDAGEAWVAALRDRPSVDDLAEALPQHRTCADDVSGHESCLRIARKQWANLRRIG